MLPISVFIFFIGVSSLFSAETAKRNNVTEIFSKAFPSASPLLIVVIGTLLILILGCFVAWEIIKTDKQKREKVSLSWQNFSELAGKSELGVEDMKLLKGLIHAGNIKQADTIFEAPGIYEKALSAFIEEFSQNYPEESLPYQELYHLRQKLDFVMVPIETPLVSTRQLTPGLPITIKSGKKSGFIKARVKEVTEQAWTIQAEGTPLSMGDNQEIMVWFIRAGDGEYHLQSRLISNQDNMMVLSHTLNLQRKQLRNWVRVDVNIPCRVSIWELNTADEIIQKELPQGLKLDGRIIDISGGGMALRLSKNIPSNSMVKLFFDLPGTPVKNAQAVVLSSNPVKKGVDDAFIHRLKFSDMEVQLQEKIIRFVFEKNRMDSQFR
ncbi:MAG: PilZ domain-containing protein [Fibrobacteria bacterium]|nr:PilZ domain-containing protein [Fibrobacteria bacterium]